MKKNEIKIGNRVVIDIYNNLGDLIVSEGTVEKIFDKYCLIRADKGYLSCINFDGEGE